MFNKLNERKSKDFFFVEKIEWEFNLRKYFGAKKKNFIGNVYRQAIMNII